MDTYISGTSRHREAIRRFLSTGVSRSSSMPSSAGCDSRPDGASFGEAPYPASSTARMTASGEAVPSTPMEFVSRLTLQEVTPGTFETAFSTRALQAAQLISVT